MAALVSFLETIVLAKLVIANCFLPKAPPPGLISPFLGPFLINVTASLPDGAILDDINNLEATSSNTSTNFGKKTSITPAFVSKK